MVSVSKSYDVQKHIHIFFWGTLYVSTFKVTGQYSVRTLSVPLQFTFLAPSANVLQCGVAYASFLILVRFLCLISSNF